jgi:hypothetical protein
LPEDNRPSRGIEWGKGWTNKGWTKQARTGCLLFFVRNLEHLNKIDVYCRILSIANF